MPYDFTCPKCKRVVTRKYKPKETIRCTYAKCRHVFPTPTGSLLTKSYDEQYAEIKRNQPRFVAPKASSKIDLGEFLFSQDEESDDDDEEDKDDKEVDTDDINNNEEKEEEKDVVHKDKAVKKPIEKKKKKIDKDDIDYILDKRSVLPPTRYARRAEKDQELLDDGILPNFVYREERDNDDDDDDILPLPDDMEEDPYALNFSSEDEKEIQEDEEEEEEEVKSKRERKGKPQAFVFPTFDDNDDDHSEYEHNEEDDDEEEEEVPEEEKDKFGSPLFSDVEQDSEEEIISKKRKGKQASSDHIKIKKTKSTSYPSIVDYLHGERENSSSNSGEDSQQENPKKKRKHRPVREVYKAGGESEKYILNENGIPVKDRLHDKTRVRKYAPKPGNRFNPYIIFNRIERQKIKDLNPEMDNHALSREVGRVYASLSQEKKQKYIDLAMKEKDEFTNLYDLNKPALPTLPPNAFILFKSRNSEAVREELKNTPTAYAYTKKMAELWKNLPKEEKYAYQEESQRLKKEFMENNPEIYKKKMDIMSKKSRARRLQKERDHYSRRR